MHLFRSGVTNCSLLCHSSDAKPAACGQTSKACYALQMFSEGLLLSKRVAFHLAPRGFKPGDIHQAEQLQTLFGCAVTQWL